MAFVEKVKEDLGVKAVHRAASEVDGTFALREEGEAYTRVFAGKNDALRLDTGRFWEEKLNYKAHSVVRRRNPELPLSGESPVFLPLAGVYRIGTDFTFDLSLIRSVSRVRIRIVADFERTK